MGVERLSVRVLYLSLDGFGINGRPLCTCAGRRMSSVLCGQVGDNGFDLHYILTGLADPQRSAGCYM